MAEQAANVAAAPELLSRPIHHLGFIVDDIPRAVATWTKLYGAGPFHLVEHMDMERLDSPLGPVVFDHSSAFGIWGSTAIELQTIHDIAPAGLKDAFAVGTTRLNHVAYVAAAGSVMSWRAAAGSRLLVFHLPGGFDRALAEGRGQDALVAMALETTGTRFLSALPLTRTTIDGSVG